MTAGPGSAAAFRPDIEGMRALAIVLVVVYHAGFPWLTGGFIGVDVFFVISGFLITGLLLREVDRTGRISVRDFYARRIKRLLPASLAVIVAVAVATYLWAPITQRAIFGGDVVAAGAYLSNWRFAARSVDYLAEDVGVSPVLHFWSLAVEEQFYVLWPLLILVAAAVARRIGMSVRLLAGVGLAMVGGVSLWWLLGTASGQSTSAFFITPTRLWEMAAGAGLAVVAGRIRSVRPGVAGLVGFVGLTAVVGSALLVDASTAWPSAWTIIPVVGTMLLITAGMVSDRSAVSRALSVRPLVWVGGISYAWYLWHWPLLVVGQQWRGLTGLRWTLILVALGVVAAWASTRFLEQPVRRSRTMTMQPHFALAVGAAVTATAVGAGLTVMVLAPREDSRQVTIEVTVSADEVTLNPPHVGAMSLVTADGTVADPPVLDSYPNAMPSPLKAGRDRPNYDCAADIPDTEPVLCPIGDGEVSTNVWVVGDSKVFQFADALDLAFQALDWNGTLATKSACAFSDANYRREGRPYHECPEYNRTVMELMAEDPPDLIITSQRMAYAFGDDPYGAETLGNMVDGLVSIWSEVQSWGTEIVVIIDNPSPPGGPSRYECLANNPEHASKCAFDPAEGIEDSGARAQLAAAQHVAGVHVIDLTEYFCADELCPVVIGDVTVYRAGSHLTNSYAITLAPVLTELLRELDLEVSDAS